MVYYMVSHFSTTTQEPLPARTFFVTSALGVKHLCCVSVIDLDSKSFDKVPFYIDEDKSVVDCFLSQSS